VNPGAILGDLARTVRERPVLVIGAGVGALLAARFLGGGDAAATDGSEAPLDPNAGGVGSGTFGLGYGPGLGGTGLYASGGEIDYGYAGDLPGAPPLVNPPPPAPAPIAPPPPAPPPPAPGPVQWWPSYLGTPPAGTDGYIVLKGTFWEYRVSGNVVTGRTSRSTGGATFYVGVRKVYTWPGHPGTYTLCRVLTGFLAGSYIAPGGAGVVTYKRKP